MYLVIADLGFTPGKEALNTSQGSRQTAREIPQPVAAALEEAIAQQKFLLVQFTAEWCIACRALEEITFADPEVASVLNAFVVVKVDTDISVEASDYFAVVGMPTLAVLDNDGQEVTRLVGQTGPDELAAALRELLNE